MTKNAADCVRLEVNGIVVEFDPDSDPRWDIFEGTSHERIGYLEVDIDNMFVGAELAPLYQRKGIATAVVRYLVHELGYRFTFWPPDGQTYEDARHLTIEGAAWANQLISQDLAAWVPDANEPDDEDW